MALAIYTGAYSVPDTTYYVKRYDPYGIVSFCGRAYANSVPMTGALLKLCGNK
jgi:hypothetical protein